MRDINIGSGAAKFARELVIGLEDYEAQEVMGQLLNGILPIERDKKIKQCAFCDHFYRDQTRNNSSKTCSSECKTSQDTARRKQKLEQQREIDPSVRPRVTNKEENYYDHYEYSFWMGHDAMERHAYNYERPHKDVLKIAAAKDAYDRIGGRIGRRAAAMSEDYYEGDY